MVALIHSVTAVSVAVASISAVAASSMCTRDGKPTKYTGPYTGGPYSGLSAQACQERCSNDSSCVAYTWNADSSSCWNYIYVSLTVTSDAPVGSVSGRCGTQVPQTNGDFPGNDLSNSLSVDAVQCSYACERTKGCNAYSWSNYNGGTCWMKNERPANASAPFDGSVVSGEVHRCTVRRDYDLQGGDFASVQRADWRECCGVCRRTKGCFASAWNNYQGGTCWLKKLYDHSVGADGVMAIV